MRKVTLGNAAVGFEVGFLLYGTRHRVLENRSLGNGEGGFAFLATDSLCVETSRSATRASTSRAPTTSA